MQNTFQLEQGIKWGVYNNCIMMRCYNENIAIIDIIDYIKRCYSVNNMLYLMIIRFDSRLL